MSILMHPGLTWTPVGVFSFGVVRIRFGKAVDDFNESIPYLSGPPLTAKLSGGFTMVWVGYALHSVPLVCALMKIHFT